MRGIGHKPAQSEKSLDKNTQLPHGVTSTTSTTTTNQQQTANYRLFFSLWWLKVGHSRKCDTKQLFLIHFCIHYWNHHLNTLFTFFKGHSWAQNWLQCDHNWVFYMLISCWKSATMLGDEIQFSLTMKRHLCIFSLLSSLLPENGETSSI